MWTQICFYLMSPAVTAVTIDSTSKPPVSRVTGVANLPAVKKALCYPFFHQPQTVFVPLLKCFHLVSGAKYFLVTWINFATIMEKCFTAQNFAIQKLTGRENSSAECSSIFSANMRFTAVNKQLGKWSFADPSLAGKATSHLPLGSLHIRAGTARIGFNNG